MPSTIEAVESDRRLRQLTDQLLFRFIKLQDMAPPARSGIGGAVRSTIGATHQLQRGALPRKQGVYGLASHLLDRLLGT